MLPERYLNRRQVEGAYQRARDVLITQANKLQERLDPNSRSPFYLGAARVLIEAKILLWEKQQKVLTRF